jgi:hypothetical protein
MARAHIGVDLAMTRVEDQTSDLRWNRGYLVCMVMFTLSITPIYDLDPVSNTAALSIEYVATRWWVEYVGEWARYISSSYYHRIDDMTDLLSTEFA